VNFQKICKSAFLAVFMFALGSTVFAQGTVSPRQAEPKMDVALGSNLYCAGYVQTAPFYAASHKDADRPDKIVGAYNEQDGWLLSQNNLLVVNGGADKGVKVGDMFSVIRPRGEVNSRWSKKGELGTYVQELGAVEVVSVKQDVSVVRVKTSCDNMLFGDLLVPFEPRHSAGYVQRPPLQRFADSSGKARGRIVLSRDDREVPSRDDIVYVDLGADDSVQAGDYLTIFRPLGMGNPLPSSPPETMGARNSGFESFSYRGGKFSNSAPRKRDDKARGTIFTTPDAKQDRPNGIRKVVGEAMVVNVKERVATVVITRVAQEIHTGDWVEIQ
jgi:hypothetical protein